MTCTEKERKLKLRRGVVGRREAIGEEKAKMFRAPTLLTLF